MFWAPLALHSLMMGQCGPKHFGGDVLKRYCDSKNVCAFVDLYCNNQIPKFYSLFSTKIHNFVARQLISKEDTFMWLYRGDLKGKTGSELITAQDQALKTKYIAPKILQTNR